MTDPQPLDSLRVDLHTLRSRHKGKAFELTITLSDDLAQKLDALLLAESRGSAVVFSVDDELTPNQVASIVGVSRPTVLKLLDDGRIPFRKVGSHRRILAKDLKEFLDEQTARKERGMIELNDIYEAGLRSRR